MTAELPHSGRCRGLLGHVGMVQADLVREDCGRPLPGIFGGLHGGRNTMLTPHLQRPPGVPTAPAPGRRILPVRAKRPHPNVRIDLHKHRTPESHPGDQSIEAGEDICSVEHGEPSHPGGHQVEAVDRDRGHGVSGPQPRRKADTLPLRHNPGELALQLVHRPVPPRPRSIVILQDCVVQIRVCLHIPGPHRVLQRAVHPQEHVVAVLLLGVRCGDVAVVPMDGGDHLRRALDHPRAGQVLVLLVSHGPSVL
mmetsp:Transcript_51412/g.135642  ORF Transcript_51412/g.135642 Transcript_51412/m.135642 type:complete len:252 (-) Transcript_51412:1544-2299(-)